MSGCIEKGTCDVCGEEHVEVERTYYNYPIKCECHSPNHFTMVRHCKGCIPTEPHETKITMSTSKLKKLVSVDDITVEMAMKVLTKALAEDKTPGSYYYVWQSNLACSLMDNANIEHDLANEIAVKFLELLINL